MKKWQAIVERWTFSPEITFHGRTFSSKDDQGKESSGPTPGLAICNSTFSAGKITAEIEFTNIEYLSTCELVFYYDPLRRYRFGAGLGGPGMFVIRQSDGFSLKTLARSGDRQNLQAGRRYKVEVSVFGSNVRLFVDSVEVLGCLLPQSLPPSQIGIKTVSSTDVHIYGFDTDSKPGKVFVVMKLSSPYTEIYEEVIKTVCKGKFGLEVNNAAETYGPGQIMADIVHDIAESEFVIAEITPENPNVYYELGYADAIRKPVIMT